MIYGYARVSTKEQSLDLQVEALSKAGVQHLFTEKVSTRKVSRKELDALIAKVVAGDSIIIWKLDRLGRSLQELIRVVMDLEKRGVDLLSISDNINTKTVQGRFFFQIVAVFAEYERSLIRERTIAGIKIAREKGRAGGRPKGISKEYLAKGQAALLMRAQKVKTQKEICASVGMSRISYYRILKTIENEIKN